MTKYDIAGILRTEVLQLTLCNSDADIQRIVKRIINTLKGIKKLEWNEADEG